MTEERTGKSPVLFVVFRRQLPSAEHSRGSRGSGQPIKACRKLQDCFPRAAIRQLSSHLPLLLGPIEPLKGFVQHRRHFGPRSSVFPGLLPSALFIWASECLRLVVPTDGFNHIKRAVAPDEAQKSCISRGSSNSRWSGRRCQSRAAEQLLRDHEYCSLGAHQSVVTYFVINISSWAKPATFAIGKNLTTYTPSDRQTTMPRISAAIVCSLNCHQIGRKPSRRINNRASRITRRMGP